MNITVQATKVSGELVPGATWLVRMGYLPNKGDQLSISIDIDDQTVLNQLRREPKSGFSVDAIDGKSYIIIKCEVTSINHIVDIATKTSTSTVVVAPINRNAEKILLFINSRSDSEWSEKLGH